MENLGFGLKHTLIIMGTASLSLCGLALILDQTVAMRGLLAGIVTGLLYQLLLHRQMKKCATMPLRKMEAYLNQGAISRFCLVLSAVILLLALREPGPSMIGFAAGLIIPFRVLIFCNVLAFLWKEPPMFSRSTVKEANFIHAPCW